MPEKLDLSALIGSRICHDLISPIGAISNGVELLMMDGVNKSPEIQLILDSVNSANSRIRFFRVAFGAVAAGDQKFSNVEVRDILYSLSPGGRVRIDWKPDEASTRRDVKLAFLMIMCLESSMPHGGLIEIERYDHRFCIEGKSERLRVDHALWEVLTDPNHSADISPSDAHFLVLREELSRQHRRLTTKIEPEKIRFSF